MPPSICPECYAKIPAELVEENGKIYIVKKCPKHGEFKEIYYEDAEIYKRFKKFAFLKKTLESYNVNASNCPYTCGLCTEHNHPTVLLNIVVTNRCDLSCWYCFFYAREGKKVYEPEKEKIREMLRRAREERPVPPVAVQYTGGEPALREDLPELVEIAKKEGFTHVQINTNGIKIAFSPELAESLKKSGASVYYLSFDGVSPETNPKNHWEIPYFMENVRKVGGPGIVLVPTVIRNVNSHELGDILEFALNHVDIVRGVNFQPISFTGRTPKEEREKYRITVAGAIKEIEEQTNGVITKDDWYPVPAEAMIAELAALLTGKKLPIFGSHFICGAATYVFREGDKVIKLKDFIDVDGFFEYVAELMEEWDGKKKGAMEKIKIARQLLKFVDFSKQPSGIDMKRILLNVLLKPSYNALSEFHIKALFIGMMHFMDPYNYDVERVRNCVIHYGTPDGRIIPFCTFNVLPEKYRDRIIEEFGTPWEEWIKEGKDEKYVRTKEFVEDTKKSDAYRKTYVEISSFW